MAFSKVIYNGTALIDLTQDTVTAGNLMSPNTAHDAAGLAITGTASGGSSTALIVDSEDSHGGIIRNVTTTSEVHLQANKNITPSSSTQVVIPDTGYDGFAQITVAAGGGGNVSGTYTPESDALTATINTGLSTVNGFIMWIPSKTTADSVRAIALILIDVTNNFHATVGENTNHTQLWSTPFADGTTRLQYTINSGNVSMTTFDENGSGYFVAEHTYQWTAW